MTSSIITLGLALCLLGPRLGAQEAPKKPGPEHKKFEMLAGNWKYEEDHTESPFGHAGKATFNSEAQMILGGFFVEEKGKGETPDGPYAWVVVTAHDPDKGNYLSFNFDSEGFSSRPWKGEVATGTLQGNTWTWTWNQEAKGKSYHLRSVNVFSPDGNINTYEWSYSEDGTTWKTWSKGKGTKVSKTQSQ
jgi:hypothetical protein